MNRFAPYAIVFVLPLGFWGGLGVAGMGLYAAANWRDFVRLSRRPLYAVLPFALVTVLAAAFGVDSRNSLPPAIGLALLITVGLQGARLMVSQSEPRKLLAAFVLGVDVLAISVAVDFALGINRIPSGLFRDPSLHNFAGTLFALAFPIALYLTGQRRPFPVIGVVSAATIFTGTALAMSWVGMVGLLVGAIAYGILSRNAYGWVLLASCVLAVGTIPTWKSAFDGALLDLRVRDQTFHNLEHTINGRLAIYNEGVRLAMQRPWLGWGYSSHVANLGAIQGLAKVRTTFAEGATAKPNLLMASDSFDRPPWEGARAIDNADVAPSGEMTADIVISQDVPGFRLYQLARVPNPQVRSYTFSVWVRADGGNAELALALRDGTAKSTSVGRLQADAATEVVGVSAARYGVDDTWQRLSLTAELVGEVIDSVHVLIYFDGYYRTSPETHSFSLWGAQLTEGTEEHPYHPATQTGHTPSLHVLSHFHSGGVQTLFESGILGAAALLLLLTTMVRLRSGPSSVLRAAQACTLGLLSTQAVDHTVHQSSLLVAAMVLMSIGCLGPANAGTRPWSGGRWSRGRSRASGVDDSARGDGDRPSRGAHQLSPTEEAF